MIKFKRIGNHNLSIPTKAYEDGAAFDMCAAISATIYPDKSLKVPLGFAADLDGHAGMLLPRSGLGSKGLVLGNLVGLIDPDYVGELTAVLWNRNPDGYPFDIKVGDKVCQLFIISFPRTHAIEVDELSETVRGEKGFGSSL